MISKDCDVTRKSALQKVSEQVCLMPETPGLPKLPAPTPFHFPRSLQHILTQRTPPGAFINDSYAE